MSTHRFLNLDRTIVSAPLFHSSHRGFVAVFVFCALFLYSQKAEAIPAFAKKYSAPCTLCHSNWPKLNVVGARFKLNGYQLEGSRDGADVGKLTPSFDLHLDTGKANVPVSLRLDGGLSIFQAKSGPAGGQANNFPCCADGNRGRLYAAGTVDQDAGYFFSYKFGDTQIEQGFIRFANIFGPGYAGVDLGAIRTADSDAVSPNREWFGSANPANFGTSNVGGRDQGMASGYTDTGARFFGNPDNGPFSYDVVVATGTRQTGSAVNSRGSAYGLMGRIDTGGFAGSFRYWGNKSGELLMRKSAGASSFSPLLGQTASSAVTTDINLSADRTSPDEKTQDYIFSFSYNAEKWQTELVYNWNDFSLDQRTRGSNTYSRETVRRTGASLSWIYNFSSRIVFGMRYGTSGVPEYKEVFNGVTSQVPSASASQYEFKLEALPVQNIKVSFQWTMDTSNEQARTDLSGKVYDLQNKLFLLWDWAI